MDWQEREREERDNASLPPFSFFLSTKVKTSRVSSMSIASEQQTVAILVIFVPIPRVTYAVRSMVQFLVRITLVDVVECL